MNLPHDVASMLWRGDEISPAGGKVVPSGFEALDRELPGGGWPVGSLTELLQAQYLQAEAQLLLPAVASQAGPARQVVVIAPPQEPFLPGWHAYGIAAAHVVAVHPRAPAEALWATEQALRANGIGAVLAWLPLALPEQVRRLQSCASDCDFPVFLLRHQAVRRQASAAPLRVQARLAGPGQAGVRILKRRGPPHDGEIILATAPPRLAELLKHARPAAGPRYTGPGSRSTLDAPLHRYRAARQPWPAT